MATKDWGRKGKDPQPQAAPLHPSLFPGDQPPFLFVAGGPIKLLVSRWYYGFAVLFTCFACAGLLFGWPNFSELLVKVGFFTSGCSPSEIADHNCNSQQLALSGVFTTGSIVSFVSPTLMGLFGNKFGPRNSLFLTTSIFLLGAVFGLAAAITGADGLIYAFAVCIGFSGQAMILPLYSYANMFPGNEGFALALLNGSFDASSLGFFIMRLLYDAGVSFVTVMGAYLGAPVGLLALHAIFLWRSKIWEPLPAEVLNHKGAPAKEGKDDGLEVVSKNSVSVAVDAASAIGSDVLEDLSAGMDQQQQQLAASSSAAVSVAVVHGAERKASLPGDETPTASSSSLAPEGSGSDGSSTMTTSLPSTSPALGAPAIHNGNEAASATDATDPLSDSTSAGSSTAAAVSVTAASSAVPDPDDLTLLPVGKQIFTLPYMLYAVWFAICMLSYTSFFSLLNANLDAVGQVHGSVVSAFGIIAPLGCLFQFLVGPMIDRLGLKVSFWVQWVSLLTLNVLGAIQVLQVQYGTMVCFAFFRALHFSNMVAFLARCFGYGTLSLTVGGVVLFGGIISLAQQGMLAWALSSAGFVPPRLLLVALAAAAVFWPIWLTFRDGKDGVRPRRRTGQQQPPMVKSS